MDTSKTHIKMCKKAKEIQALRANKTGDFIAGKSWVGVFIEDESYSYDIGCPLPDDENRDIWLPRQDQLYDMLEDCLLETDEDKTPGQLCWTIVGEIDSCHNDWSGDVSEYYKQFTSMEQLWLAIVMKRKFKKDWSPEKEDWVSAG